MAFSCGFVLKCLTVRLHILNVVIPQDAPGDDDKVWAKRRVPYFFLPLSSLTFEALKRASSAGTKRKPPVTMPMRTVCST